MLQITTGKFFTTDELYVTRHRAVLYTNYAAEGSFRESEPPVFMPASLSTVVGSLTSATSIRPPGGIYPWFYEVDEKLEAVRPDGTKEFLVSVGADYIVQDFAAVAAFGLNITCTPDIELARRLILGEHPALGVMKSPREFIARVFDQTVTSAEEDASSLSEIVDDLVGLDRRTYVNAIRAIRRYVNGLQRISDDLDLAYVLLVASVESLAQEFDDFTPVWTDVDQRRRDTLDQQLASVDAEAADLIRSTLLRHEHLSLARRFREFAIDHLRPSFFREEAVDQLGPIRYSDVTKALDRAYQFRSKYIHRLLELPRYLTASPDHRDTALIEGLPTFTFHGLARLARHVIRTFIASAPKIEHETLDYRSELPNIVKVPLAFRVWGSWSQNFDHRSVRSYLSGFLEEFTSALLVKPGEKPTLTDVRPLLEKVEKLTPGLATTEQRMQMLALYHLFHRCLPKEEHLPGAAEFVGRFNQDFSMPTIECMLLHTVESTIPDWPVEEFEAVWLAYTRQRGSKSGVSFGAFLESAVMLTLAERNRVEGREQRARALISEAVENLPGHQFLMDFERSQSSSSLPPLHWRSLLLGHAESEERPRSS